VVPVPGLSASEYDVHPLPKGGFDRMGMKEMKDAYVAKMEAQVSEWAPS